MPAAGVTAHYWTHPEVTGAEFSAVALATHRFPPHAHDALAIGVVDSGIGRMWCRGAVHLGPPQAVFLIPRGEGHTGDRLGETVLRYRMMYVTAALQEQLGFREQRLRAVAPTDGSAARPVRRAHELSRRGATRLELESALVRMLDAIYFRYGAGHVRTDAAPARARLRAVRDLVVELAAAGLAVRDLALLAGCSPEHLVRAFRREFGLAPHQLQVSVRVSRARRLLAAGATPAAAARECGFADQSHLTRHFRRQLAQTPAAYRQHLHAS